MTQTDTKDDAPSIDVILLYAFTGIAALGTLLATALTQDPLFRFQGYIAFTAFLIAFCSMSIGLGGGRWRTDPGRYADGVIRAGVIATMVWAIAGLAAGALAAAQLTWPTLFYFPDAPWLNFGRLRPLHTSAVIFAFCGNALICTSFYVVQRTSKARLAGGVWPWFVFWGTPSRQLSPWQRR